MTAEELAGRWKLLAPLAAEYYGAGVTKGKIVRQEYSVSIERAGVVDLPELCRCTSADSMAEVIRALVATHDPLIMAVHVSIVRLPLPG